jgi:eukaryotic-like serine/threonine-protein kinase
VSLAPGTRLGPYEILSPLGAGGMGEVYRARDDRLVRDVAVKVLPASVATDAERVRRFENEARATGALSHPNILVIYDIGTHEGSPYLVEELLEGQTLRELLEKGALPVHRAVEVAFQVAQGLAAAHGKNIVHRDLKPENLFVTRDGHVKILDFGLAKLLGGCEPGTAPASTVSGATLPGTVLGTLGYMSPEQLRAAPVDHRADLFAFGAILYEMLTGRPAFRRATAAETAAAILHEDPVASAPVGLASGLVTLMRRCLEKDPGARQFTAADLVLELQAEGSDRPGAQMPTAASNPAIASLVVLPFTNLGADPATEYLSDGIAESLLHKLSPLPGLRVLGRATAFRMRGRDADPVSVGRELGVDGVVTGRVLMLGGRFVVRAELTATADGSQVWGAQHDRGPDDILAIQEEIGRTLAARLRPRLTSRQRQRLRVRSTESARAYDLYLKGRHLWNRFTEPSWDEAIACFREAIEIDPGYALAYSGLADCFTVLGANVRRPRHCFPQAAAAARRARELAPDLAEAFASMCAVRLFWDWDFDAADQDARQAITLDPGYAAAHQVHAYSLYASGDSEGAIAAVGKALDLDPLSSLISGDLAYHLYLHGSHGEALERARHTVISDPRLAWGHEVMGLALERLGLVEEAVAAFRRALGLSGSPAMTARLVYGLARAGQMEEARRLMARVESESEERYVPPTCLVYALGALGETERALAKAREAYEERDRWLIWHRDPVYDSVRKERTFEEIVRKLGPRA